MQIDFHLHPDYSLDALGTVEEYCRMAVKLGFDAICLTTHFDNDPRRPQDRQVRYGGEAVSIDNHKWLIEYVARVRDAQRDYRNRGLFVGLGVEFDYYPDCQSDAKNLRDSFPFDYLLVSVHTVRTTHLHLRDEANTLFATMTPDQICREYYDSVLGAVNSGLFSAVGHLDGYRKYGTQYFDNKLAEIHDKYAKPALAAMAKQQVALEINSTAAFNAKKGRDMMYGVGSLLKLAKEVGLNLVTHGSDSHRPEHLESNGTLRARQHLLEAGFDRIYAFKKLKPYGVPL